MKLKNLNELSRLKIPLAHHLFEVLKPAFIFSSYSVFNAYVSDSALNPSLCYLTQSTHRWKKLGLKVKSLPKFTQLKTGKIGAWPRKHTILPKFDLKVTSLWFAIYTFPLLRIRICPSPILSTSLPFSPKSQRWPSYSQGYVSSLRAKKWNSTKRIELSDLPKLSTHWGLILATTNVHFICSKKSSFSPEKAKKS